jgi:hypothetical protein
MYLGRYSSGGETPTEFRVKRLGGTPIPNLHVSAADPIYEDG